MAILVTVLLGALVGWLASVVMKRDAQQGWLENILVGVFGALVGSFIGSLVDGTDGASFLITPTFGSLAWAFVGAVVVCAALNYFQSRRLR